MQIQFKKNHTGFTIVELLVVIVVLGILAAIVIATLNPGEISAQAHDSSRITDINNLKNVIDLFVVNKSDPNLLGTSQKVYISIPDTSSTCTNITGLPALPSGWSYNCVTNANLKNANGTGWIPINLTSATNSGSITVLPIDPQNDAASGRYYTYTVNTTNGSYELTSLLESQKENVAAINDGGSLPGVYQNGTNIGLTPTTRDKGLVGYWPFDGTGAIVNGQTSGLADSSGKGYNGSALNANGTGMNFTTGKIGNAVQFDGIDDSIAIPTIYSGNTDWTMSAWIKTSSTDVRSILSNASGGPVYNLFGIGSSKITYSHYDVSWKFEYGTSNIADGTWHHLAWVNNGSSKIVDLYVDGVKEASVPSTTETNAPVNKLGGAWTALYFWNGSLDDIRFYSRSLSTTELKAIYNATK